MIFGGGLLAVALLALWVYCIFDVIATDEASARNLPKLVWLVVVIFVPTIGSVAWLVLGRPQDRGARPGDSRYRRSPTRPAGPRARPPAGGPGPRRGPVGPEDSPEFLSDLERRLGEEPPER